MSAEYPNMKTSVSDDRVVFHVRTGHGAGRYFVADKPNWLGRLMGLTWKREIEIASAQALAYMEQVRADWRVRDEAIAEVLEEGAE